MQLNTIQSIRAQFLPRYSPRPIKRASMTLIAAGMINIIPITPRNGTERPITNIAIIKSIDNPALI